MDDVVAAHGLSATEGLARDGIDQRLDVTFLLFYTSYCVCVCVLGSIVFEVRLVKKFSW